MNALTKTTDGAVATASTLPVTDIEVTAENPDEMQQCQSALIDWCERKVMAVRAEAAELTSAAAIAVKNKWRASTLQRHAVLAEKRVSFYERILAALRAGYQIIPDLPATIFAIRTDKKKPKAMYRYEETWSDSEPGVYKEQEAKQLPAGEGDYKNPLPAARIDDKGEVVKKDGTKRHVWAHWADKWREVEFPFQMAKPKIMEATTRAMLLKIFDDIGIVDDRRGDPIIVARIRRPAWNKYDQRRVAFIIGWHLNTRDL
jgi:hypothetical protein